MSIGYGTLCNLTKCKRPAPFKYFHKPSNITIVITVKGRLVLEGKQEDLVLQSLYPDPVLAKLLKDFKEVSSGDNRLYVYSAKYKIPQIAKPFYDFLGEHDTYCRQVRKIRRRARQLKMKFKPVSYLTRTEPTIRTFITNLAATFYYPRDGYVHWEVTALPAADDRLWRDIKNTFVLFSSKLLLTLGWFKVVIHKAKLEGYVHIGKDNFDITVYLPLDIWDEYMLIAIKRKHSSFCVDRRASIKTPLYLYVVELKTRKVLEREDAMRVVPRKYQITFNPDRDLMVSTKHFTI